MDGIYIYVFVYVFCTCINSPSAAASALYWQMVLLFEQRENQHVQRSIQLDALRFYIAQIAHVHGNKLSTFENNIVNLILYINIKIVYAHFIYGIKLMDFMKS